MSRKKNVACPRHGFGYTSHELVCKRCDGYGLCLACLVENGHGIQNEGTPPPPKQIDVFCYLCVVGAGTAARHRENRSARRAAEGFA